MSLARRVQRREQDALLAEFKKFHDRLRKLENQHSPTVPVYDPDPPDDGVDAQFALMSTTPAPAAISPAQPYFFFAGEWHPLSPADGRGIFKYIALDGRADLDDVLSFPEPAWELRTPAPDAGMFDADISAGVRILLPGLYLCRNEMRVATDWGLAHILALIDITTGGGASDYLPGFGENDTRLSYYFSEGSAAVSPAPPSPAVGLNLVHEGIVKISDPGTGILFNLEVSTDTTYSDVLFQQFVMRLSSSYTADQS